MLSIEPVVLLSQSLNIENHISHGNIDASLNRLITITTHFPCLDVFDHATDFITAAQLANALPATMCYSYICIFSRSQYGRVTAKLSLP